MTNSLTTGSLLVATADTMEGRFSPDVTRAPKWTWANNCGLGLFIALGVVPWPLELLTVPYELQVDAWLSPATLLLTFLFGIGWGVEGPFLPGDFGAYVGFPMMPVCSNLLGNRAGAVTGVGWGMSLRARTTLAVGVVLLIAALAVMGVANYLLQK